MTYFSRLMYGKSLQKFAHHSIDGTLFNLHGIQQFLIINWEHIPNTYNLKLTLSHGSCEQSENSKTCCTTRRNE